MGGLGIYATSVLNKHDEIAGGIVDNTCHDSSTLSLCSDGVLMGPVALANSACIDCANALFSRRRDGSWVLVASKRIKRGTEVTVPYAQHDTDGKPLQCACGAALTGDAIELDGGSGSDKLDE